MSMPKLRVDHPEGYDLLATDGTLDFDGGSLIVWRDRNRGHLLAAYGPGGWLSCSWEEGSHGEVRSESGRT